MKLGARGQFFLASLAMFGVVGALSGYTLHRQVRDILLREGHAGERVGETLAAVRQGMAVAFVVGLLAAVALSALASERLTRELRALVKKARRVSKGKEERIVLPVEGELGKLAGSFNRITDDLHKTEEKLERERARLHTVLHDMDEGVLALDERGDVRIANPAALRALGLAERPNTQPFASLTRAQSLLALADRSLAGHSASDELELPSTPPRRYVVRATPLERIGGAVLVMHDVTEARRLDTMRRDFVANVSHELRTPVSVIAANAETLLGGGLEDAASATDFVEAILRNAQRLARLISDLLDLSRIEAGHYSIHVEPVPVAEALADAAAEVAVHAAERRIDVHVEPCEALFVAADGAALEHVLLNLLDNAVKYTPEAGHVVTRAVATPHGVRLEVEDDGPGIPADARARVFERFYRVDHGRSREMGGTGLGLAIVKHLAEQMAGTVGVSPAPDRGSIFWVELPSARDVA